MKRLSLAFAVGVLSLLASACGPGLLGSGNIVSQTRTVPAFSSLGVENGLPVTFTIGARSVLVQGDDNLLPYVETFVRGNTLVVRERPNVNLPSSRLLVVVANPTLAGLDASGGSAVTASLTAQSAFRVDASGGSRVVLDEVSAGEFTAEASGGSTLTATGAATHAGLDVSGGSWMHGRGLVVHAADVDVSGGAHLELTVLSQVSGEVSGGSHTTIYGRPGGHLNATGGSTVIWAGD